MPYLSRLSTRESSGAHRRGWPGLCTPGRTSIIAGLRTGISNGGTEESNPQIVKHIGRIAFAEKIVMGGVVEQHRVQPFYDVLDLGVDLTG